MHTMLTDESEGVHLSRVWRRLGCAEPLCLGGTSRRPDTQLGSPTHSQPFRPARVSFTLARAAGRTFHVLWSLESRYQKVTGSTERSPIATAGPREEAAAALSRRCPNRWWKFAPRSAKKRNRGAIHTYLP